MTLTQKNVTVVPLHEQQVDIGGGRMAFITYQLYNLLAAYDEQGEHARLIVQAVRLFYAITIRHDAKDQREIRAEFELVYHQLVQALNGLCGTHELYELGDWLLWRQKETRDGQAVAS